MRLQRLQIRIIQTAVLMTVLVVIGTFISQNIFGGNESPADTGVRENDENLAALEQTQTNTKIVALGDSFTYGFPGNPSKSWTKHLGDKLGIEVVNKGLISQTSKDLWDRFDQDVLAENPGRVIIFAGNGDILQEVEPEIFQENIKALVDKAKDKDIVPVLALPLPYSGFKQETKTFREWTMNYAQENNILMLDFSEVLYDQEQAKFLRGLSGDGKYPSAKGYEAMGDYAAQVLR